MDSTHGERARRLLITGASGYIGRRLVSAARERGFEVVATVREPRHRAPARGVTVGSFDLTRTDDLDGMLAGIDGVIHLAAIIAESSRPAGADEDLNVSGTRRLLDAARRQGVRRFVFLSSQSAAEDSPTSYGRSKWEIEQLLNGKGECSVRTGLVSGGPPRGVYGTLFRLVKRMPVLPFVRPRAPVYPVHVDDLCGSVLSLFESGPEPPALMRVASAAPVPFGRYVRALAAHRLGRRVRLLPIPARLVLVLSRLTDALPFLPTVSGERVRGLIALRHMDAATIPAPPGAPRPREVFEALAREGRGRRLLAEGRTLTGYVLGARAPCGVLRRYVRAVLAEDDPEPLDVPGAARAWPRLLRLSEPLLAPDGDRLRRRLVIATRIAEMTPAAAPLFHNYRKRPRWFAWLALARLAVVEAVLLPFRWCATQRRKGTFRFFRK
jgi:NADH dehydrogenase